ncbi:MAG: hypothetical protein E7527_00925 [Ruminococcaceae bacterium]|nr:hypothetical protein [Oscillospiraceae bacterium]
MKKIGLWIMILCLVSGLTTGCGAQEEANEETATTIATRYSFKDGVLTEEGAKEFAFFCAGTTESKVTNYQCKKIYHEERKCDAYEISFDVGRAHYEYVLRTTDGDIIKNEKTIND